jgi:hypothetical protein
LEADPDALADTATSPIKMPGLAESEKDDAGARRMLHMNEVGVQVEGEEVLVPPPPPAYVPPSEKKKRHKAVVKGAAVPAVQGEGRRETEAASTEDRREQ